MADIKSTTPKPAKAEPEEKPAPVDMGQWEEPSERDRSKRRMSEGVRYELQVNGFAVDPNTGDLLVSDNGGESVDVIPREKAAEEMRKRTKAIEERNKAVKPEGPGL